MIKRNEQFFLIGSLLNTSNEHVFFGARQQCFNLTSLRRTL